MARDIAPTPPLRGQAAIDFFEEMEKHKKASEEEKQRIEEHYKIFKSWCKDIDF